MKRIALITGLLATCPSALADTWPLSAACETALALSAAPAHLRADAGVYLLGKDGYEATRESGNGYTCLVERNHPQSIIPQCFDDAARDAHVALILEDGKLLRKGESFEKIAERRRARLADPDVPVATRPGVVYMVSDYNYIHVAGRDALLKVAPHVMFHAPRLSNADIGSNPQAAFANPGIPFVTQQGPHGFMTSFVAHASDSADVERECRGQLPPSDGFVPFPPVAAP